MPTRGERYSAMPPTPAKIAGLALSLEQDEVVGVYRREGDEHGVHRVRGEADARTEDRDDHAPSAGLITRAALKSDEFRATAFGSSAGPTIWYVNACRAGASNTSTVPRSTARTYTCHGSGSPASAAARAPWPRPSLRPGSS